MENYLEEFHSDLTDDYLANYSRENLSYNRKGEKYFDKDIKFENKRTKNELTKFSDLMKKHSIYTRSFNIDIDRQGNKVYSFVLGAKSETIKTNFMKKVLIKK